MSFYGAFHPKKYSIFAFFLAFVCIYSVGIVAHADTSSTPTVSSPDTNITIDNSPAPAPTSTSTPTTTTTTNTSSSTSAPSSSSSSSSSSTNDPTKKNFQINIKNLFSFMGSSNKNIPSGKGSMELIFERVTGLMLTLIPILASVSLLVAGYVYVFSAGSSESLTLAKSIIKWNIIAIAIALLSVVIVKIVATLTNVSA